MTSPDKKTVSARIPESLDQRVERALGETSKCKSEVISEALVDFAESIEGETPASIERKIDDLKEDLDAERERKRAAENNIARIESRIVDLEARLNEMRSRGDVDDLREELATMYESGADLWSVDSNTDKVETFRRLADLDSTEEAIDAIHQYANEGDAR